MKIEVTLMIARICETAVSYLSRNVLTFYTKLVCFYLTGLFQVTDLYMVVVNLHFSHQS